MRSQQRDGRIVKLHNNPIKQYDWGSTNHDSFVGRFSKNNLCKTYAELWMGVHANGQSEVEVHSEPGLSKFIKFSQFLASNKTEPIQFLFKVLSIQKCLSIQVHPNKSQAVELNRDYPSAYPDDNDKPEMFYTLSWFQCFLGYVSEQYFSRLIKLQYFSKISQSKSPKQAMLALSTLSEQDQQQIIINCLDHLKQIHPSRYNSENKSNKIWKINSDFPNDIGIVVSFFLEYRLLPAGVCFFIDSNVPHAYIYGQCLEVMKNSDNVCRLGLTPKFKDPKAMQTVLIDTYTDIKQIEPIITKHDSVQYALLAKNGLNMEIITSLEAESEVTFAINQHRVSRILLLLEGTLSISHKESQNLQQCEAGTVIFLQPETQYKAKFKKGKATACITWSEFGDPRQK